MSWARIARRDVQGALSTFFFQLGLLGEIGGVHIPGFDIFTQPRPIAVFGSHGPGHAVSVSCPGLGRPIMDLGSWLRSLGLAQYEAAFRENAINEAILPKLTAEDLKDIGVTAVGHRRVLLDAIARLRGETPPGAATEPANNPNRIGGALPEAERRQLTVMFCDLVGSTALSVRMDPEDLRALIGAYHRCCAEMVERNGGFVAKYMGDGVLAYFGYPQAHEHDAERAVRAGLNVVEAVPKLATNAGSPLRVRVGIATGLVVVGDLIGAGAAQEQAVVGETPNLAGRLQALAEPGAVVIAASTRRLTGGLFDYRDLGAMALKGFGENVPAWQVLGASAVESRFEAMRTAMTPLVGRDEEIDLLMRRWEQAKGGDGQVVLISGEPGIGKSRLAETILERLSNELHIRLRYFCSPHHQDSALYPSFASRYGANFDRRVRGLGIRQVRTPFRSPRANAVAERWVRSVRSECLDHLIVFNEAHLRRVLFAYVTYYNRWRPYRSLGQAVPCGEARPLPRQACRKIVAEPVLGGLHHIYRAAA
jgi:class 3 adenylate cyclase